MRGTSDRRITHSSLLTRSNLSERSRDGGTNLIFAVHFQSLMCVNEWKQRGYFQLRVYWECLLGLARACVLSACRACYRGSRGPVSGLGWIHLCSRWTPWQQRLIRWTMFAPSSQTFTSHCLSRHHCKVNTDAHIPRLDTQVPLFLFLAHASRKRGVWQLFCMTFRGCFSFC